MTYPIGTYVKGSEERIALHPDEAVELVWQGFHYSGEEPPPPAPSATFLATVAAILNTINSTTSDLSLALNERFMSALEVAAEKAEIAASVAEAAASAQEAAAVTGLTGEDEAVALLVSTPGSDTATAVEGAITDAIEDAVQPVENIVAHGATPAAASAAIQAAHDALPVKGGIIVIPQGDWECATTVNITKQVEIVGAGGSNEFSNTRLRFAAGVKGFNVALPGSGDTFKMSDVALLSYSVAAAAGAYGVHLKKGRPIITNCVAYQFGDHGWFFDSTDTAPPNNVNHAVCINIRAYGNWGDGIRISGPDSNAMTFISPDVVANRGWGINCESPHNLFLHPHADQQYHSSPGAYRDDALSNRWEMVYSEGGVGAFRIDANSGHGYFSTSAFGATPIIKTGTAHQTWEIVRTAGARELVRTTNMVKDFAFGVGLINANSLDIVNLTDAVNVASMKVDGTENTWWGGHIPAANNTKDLGWSGGRWRDVFVGRYLYGASYATAGRPSPTGATGAMIYDTTLSKPIWSDGTAWRDAAGTAV